MEYVSYASQNLFGAVVLVKLITTSGRSLETMQGLLLWKWKWFIEISRIKFGSQGLIYNKKAQSFVFGFAV